MTNKNDANDIHIAKYGGLGAYTVVTHLKFAVLRHPIAYDKEPDKANACSREQAPISWQKKQQHITVCMSANHMLRSKSYMWNMAYN